MEKVLESAENSKDSKLDKDGLIQATSPKFEPASEPVWAACSWMLLQVKPGYVSEQFARQRVSAIKSLFLDTDAVEITVQAFYERLTDPVYHTQWINSREQQGLANRKTLQTYLGRAAFTLGEYIERSAVGGAYDRGRLTRYTDSKKSASAKKPNGNGMHKTVTRSAPVPVLPTPVAAEAGVFEIPLQVGARGSARIRFDFDPVDLTIDDIGKIVLQLAGRASSFSTHDAGKLGARLAADAANFNPMKTVAEQMFPSAG